MTVMKNTGSGGDCFLPQFCPLGNKTRTKLTGDNAWRVTSTSLRKPCYITSLLFQLPWRLTPAAPTREAVLKFSNGSGAFHIPGNSLNSHISEHICLFISLSKDLLGPTSGALYAVPCIWPLELHTAFCNYNLLVFFF